MTPFLSTLQHLSLSLSLVTYKVKSKLFIIKYSPPRDLFSPPSPSPSPSPSPMPSYVAFVLPKLLPEQPGRPAVPWTQCVSSCLMPLHLCASFPLLVAISSSICPQSTLGSLPHQSTLQISILTYQVTLFTSLVGKEQAIMLLWACEWGVDGLV